MKTHRLLKVLFLAALVFQLQAQETVFVESTQKGKGILKARSGECFVITPEHVVHEDASSLNIIGSKNVLSKGKLIQVMEGVDLAIVRVMDGGKQNCTNWSVPKNYSSILDNTVTAYLELRGETGGTELIQVFINGKDEEMISIVPNSPKDAIIKGMSGGALFTQYKGKKVYLGMLLQVGEEGEGYVYQADDMERVLGGFFGENTKQHTVASMTMNPAVASAMSVEEEGYRFDLISVKKSGTNVICKFKVTSLEKDGQLYFRAARNSEDSYIHDQNGIKTIASNVKLGNQSHKSEVGRDYTLIQGVPVPLELTFKEVSNDASGISILNLNVWNGQVRSLLNIKFRNISFKTDGSEFEIPSFENVEYSEEIDGYRFDLMSVKKSGTSVKCKFRVTSLVKDGQLYFRAARNSENSFIHDQNGIKTIAANVKLGNQSHKSEVGRDYCLVKGVPVPLELNFKDVSPDALGASILNLNVWDGENRALLNIKFRNISFNPEESKLEIPSLENVEYSEEIDDYRFDLLSVNKSGTNVICKFRVTSLVKDGQLYFRAARNAEDSFIYDQNGIKTIASNVKLGNQSHKSEVGRDYCLVKGVPVPLELTFKEVSPDASGATILNLNIWNGENRSLLNIKFRNISF